MSYELIEVEKKDHLTIVTINRPDVMNAISPPTNAEMDRAFNEFDEDPEKFLKNMLNSKIDNSEEFKPRTREELLALDLAEGLNDRKSLPTYLTYARRYPEGFLRRTAAADFVRSAFELVRRVWSAHERSVREVMR